MTIVCPHCPRKLPDANAGWQHIRTKHGVKAAHAFRAEHAPAEEREKSTGERLVDALEAARCGQPVPEHIALMFPDEIEAARSRGRPA